ncbi:MAG: pyruvate dehydrogenase (acetyl-transferring) E1 component subunit alpha [Bacteriovoracaceae bacterium]|nr:pyruvate dehydrogenase (acetyl-transferring) E1 component subunit alpha [Bacteroidota bacterium]
MKEEKKKAKLARWVDLNLSNEKLIKMYRDMLHIRRFEERAAQEYGKGKIGGFCHLYIGQEATGVGAISALREDDFIYTAYRDHGLALARGMESKGCMAELFGKATGVSKGIGGSMHFYDLAKGFMGGWGIVGGHPPLAAGSAFATKYQGRDSVTICFMGEASTNQGVFHETLNMAQLWKLPVIFICENNGYGMGTAISRAMAGEHLFEKAAGYEMARGAVNGMDVIEMYREMSVAINRARTEMLPTFIEARTYRYRGHSMSDPGQYRTKEEIEEYKKRDPVETFGKELIAEGILKETDLEAMDELIKQEVQEAVEFADASPQPSLDVLHNNIYA